MSSGEIPENFWQQHQTPRWVSENQYEHKNLEIVAVFWFRASEVLVLRSRDSSIIYTAQYFHNMFGSVSE